MPACGDEPGFRELNVATVRPQPLPPLLVLLVTLHHDRRHSAPYYRLLLLLSRAQSCESMARLYFSI